MSTEIIAIVVSSAGVVVTVGVALFAGLAWVVRRIDAVESKLTTRIDAVEDKLVERIDAMGRELTEVKVSVARWEGPRPRLILGG
ncbi:hypothetical protein HLA99_15770 [Microbacterium ulmi]|uniref:Uncharacterized protein n=1 Tax=Microbacterium ulmi TaxID=179095 RepID=A0A7Y2Q1E4_9MICO|nr:hypothetical protein [Microbacterium ulmi]